MTFLVSDITKLYIISKKWLLLVSKNLCLSHMLIIPIHTIPASNYSEINWEMLTSHVLRSFTNSDQYSVWILFMSGRRSDIFKVNKMCLKYVSRTKTDRYEGCSKISDLYLYIFERHTIHHSIELYVTLKFIIMLIFPRYTDSFNNFSILYIAHSIPLASFFFFFFLIV